jgi:transcription elongation factor GreA
MTTATVTNLKPQLTQVGYEDLSQELKTLEEVRLPAIIKRVEAARAYGDLSENSEYHSAKEDQELIETRISEIKTVLENATIVKSSHKASSIGIGSQVTVCVKSKRSEKKMVLHIVGEFEADPKAGKISSASPLGHALIGRKKGEKVEVDAPAGKVIFKDGSVSLCFFRKNWLSVLIITSNSTLFTISVNSVYVEMTSVILIRCAATADKIA